MATLTASKPADLHIPKLTTSNYKVWSELTTEALKGRAVWNMPRERWKDLRKRTNSRYGSRTTP
jgi:hypothetical protein